MDQNYQPYSFYQEEQPIKNAAYYRGEARDALRGKWPISAVIFFLFSLISSAVVSICTVPMFISLFAVASNPDDMAAGTIVLSMLMGMLFIFLISVFALSPITAGLYRVYLDLIDGKDARFETLFSRFTKGYGNTVLTYLLYSLLVFATMIPMIVALIAAIFVSAIVTIPTLATLLNVCIVLVGAAISLVLCILVTYRYALAFFILAEYPTLRAVDVLRNSAALMNGNKWKYFCLQISFIGWALLLILLSFVTCGIGSIIGQSLLYIYLYTAQAAFYHDVAKRDAANDVEFPSLDPNDYNPDEDPNRPF